MWRQVSNDHATGVHHGPARLLRGWFAAFFATGIAAASHVLAEGPHDGVAGQHSHQLDPIVWILTLALAGPVCTGLAGRALSMWRTAASVASSQLVFHLAFSLTGGGHHSAVNALHHGHHVDAIVIDSASQLATQTGSIHDGWAMFAAHIGAALATFWLIHHGERTLLHIADAILAPTSRRMLAHGVKHRSVPRAMQWLNDTHLPPSYVLTALPHRRGPPVLTFSP